MKDDKKVVITYGTFDLFHIGHLNLLKRAKALGDFLIVGVSTDEFNELKGKKAIMPYEHRKEIVSAIKCVDMVIAEETWEQKIEDFKKYDVDILVMGDDWKGKFDHFKEYVDVVYLPRTKGISTSMLKKVLSSVDKIDLNLKDVEKLINALEQIDFSAIERAIEVLKMFSKALE